MPNGRCRMHGGTNPGAPIQHGRRSKYIQVFGENFAQLLRDPDLLKCDAEIALFDQFLGEQVGMLESGISSSWIDDLRKTVADLREALFITPDAAKARNSFRELEQGLEAAGRRFEVWQETLQAARSRAEVAVKADTVLAKRESAVTDATVAALLMRTLEIFIDVAGSELGAQAAARMDREVFGSVAAGARREAAGTGGRTLAN